MTIKGLSSLKRKLAALPVEAEKEIREALEAGAEEIVTLAKRLAPKDDGALRDSIGWTYGDAPKGSIALSSAGTGKLKITVYAGNDEAFYARFVEFGTAAHPQGGVFKGGQHPGTPAQPFFFPAYRTSRKRVKSRIGRAIRKSAKQAAAGA